MGTSETRIIIPGSVQEHRKLIVGRRAKELSDIVDEHNLSPIIEGRIEDLHKILKDPDTRVRGFYDYLDTILGSKWSKEGSEHCKKMYAFVVAIATLCGITDRDELHRAGYAAIMHDVGKLALPDEVIYAMEHGLVFSPKHKGLVRVHSLTGYLIAKGATEGIDDLTGVEDIIYAHHEECDGLGYIGMVGDGRNLPLGPEDEIPLVSMIISVVDAYLAVARKRKYDPATPHNETLQEIMRGAYHLPYVTDILRKYNRDKMDALKTDCKKKHGDNWEIQYRSSLINMVSNNTRVELSTLIDDNTRDQVITGVPRRLPEGEFVQNYNELLKQLPDNRLSWDYKKLLDPHTPIEVIEKAYMDIRLAAERKYYPIVVRSFIECVTRYPHLIEQCQDQQAG